MLVYAASMAPYWGVGRRGFAGLMARDPNQYPNLCIFGHYCGAGPVPTVLALWSVIVISLISTIFRSFTGFSPKMAPLGVTIAFFGRFWSVAGFLTGMCVVYSYKIVSESDPGTYTREDK